MLREQSRGTQDQNQAQAGPHGSGGPDERASQQANWEASGIPVGNQYGMPVPFDEEGNPVPFDEQGMPMPFDDQGMPVPLQGIPHPLPAILTKKYYRTADPGAEHSQPAVYERHDARQEDVASVIDLLQLTLALAAEEPGELLPAQEKLSSLLAGQRAQAVTAHLQACLKAVDPSAVVWQLSIEPGREQMLDECRHALARADLGLPADQSDPIKQAMLDRGADALREWAGHLLDAAGTSTTLMQVHNDIRQRLERAEAQGTDELKAFCGVAGEHFATQGVALGLSLFLAPVTGMIGPLVIGVNAIVRSLAKKLTQPTPMTDALGSLRWPPEGGKGLRDVTPRWKAPS